MAMLEEEQVDVDHVVDIDEVAPLLAVAVAARADEQPHPARCQELLVGVERDRRHAPLVRLVGTVDVEIAQADDLGGAAGERAPHQLVEQELGVAVDVERPLAAALLAEIGPRAVDRGRRGVHQRHLLLLAPVEHELGVAVVVLHHVAAVGLHGVRAGALVQHRLDRAAEAFQPLQELALVQVVGDLEPREVAHLVRMLQVVHRHDVAYAGGVQPLDDLRADEARGSRNHVVVAHASPNSSRRVAAAGPSLPTTMPAARLASRTAASSPAPAASMTASAAITVSPAPVTSDTSRLSAFTERVFLPWKSVMPSAPRVRSSASSPSCARSACARRTRSFSSFQRPTTSRSSARFGVMMLQPL